MTWILTLCASLILFVVGKSLGQPVINYPNPDGSTEITLNEGVVASTQVLAVITNSATDVITLVSVVDFVTSTNKISDIDISATTIRTKVVLDYEITEAYRITVQATNGGFSSSATFVLRVNDKNDNSPMITGTLTANFNEEQPAFTLVFSGAAFSVSDNDAGDTHTFSLSGAPASYFSVSRNSGDVVVNSKLDRDAAGAITVFAPIILTVTDAGGNTGTASLTVSLIDINDNAPACTPVLITTSVPENSVSGTVVATMTCTDKDAGANGVIGTSSIASGDDSSSKFHVTTATGVQIETTSRPLNYESKTQYTMIIHIPDTGATPMTGTATVIVQVTAVNEFAPAWGTFTPAGPGYTISEAVGVGTSVATITATENDAGPDGQIEYTIVSTTDNSGTPVGGIFSLHTTSGQLSTASSLERDGPAGVTSYTVRVRAQDKGSLVLSAPDQILTITISDVNDNSPVFLPASYSVTGMLESAFVAAGVSIVQVTASDADLAGTGTLVYQIGGGDTLNKFRFSTSTAGLLELNSAIAIDKPAQEAYYYVLTVEANDKGLPNTPARTGTTTVTVSIRPENNNWPVFGAAAPSSSVSVPEDAAVGTSVVTVTATDNDVDRGVPQTIRYAFQIATSAFTIDPITGVVSTATALDHETAPSYTLTITATDNGGTPKSSTTTVTITVTNVNEHAPTCTAYDITASINEGVTATVTTLSCTDDLGETLTYSMVPSHASFSVGATTGVVSTIVALDYESTTTYSLTIEVRDSVAPIKTSTVKLTVLVQPVNESPPVFNPVTYTTTLAENTAAGTSVVTVTATDADKGASHGTIRYSIVSGNGAGCFSININTGEIQTTSVAADRESSSTRTLEVRAADDTPGAATEKTASTTVIITILDVNDNAPECTPLHYKVSVIEPSTVGAKVVTLTSTDDDETGTPNATPTFAITAASNTGGVFVMAGADVTLAQVVNYETKTSYSLIIVVRDNGSPTQLSSTCQVDVTIVAANEFPPVATMPNYSGTLAETTPIGTTAYSPQFTDGDTGTGSVMNYSITSGNTNNDFFCYANSGLVVVWNALDFDTPPQNYNLTVIATDDGGLQGSMWLYFDLTNVNDHTPIFTKNVYAVSVPENALLNTLVGTVIASDADIGDTVTYTAVSGNGVAFFQVHPGTGAVTNNASLDRETRGRFSLVIQAVDTVTPTPHSATTLVDITVTDVNDNSPEFTPADFTVNIPETALSGTTVTTVFAVDKDTTASNNVFSYVLTDPLFTVDAATGVITTIAGVDREAKAAHVLTVLGIDQGAPSRTGTATVTVVLDDVNDNTPAIVGTYNPSVSEDAVVNLVVTRITANDPDVGENARLSYTITGGNTNSDFKIDAGSGIIQVQNSLDRERTNVYNVEVKVADNGTPAKTATTTVTITITDINDNDPIWLAASYTFTVSENRSPGVSIGTIVATDKDVGMNSVLVYSVALFWSGNAAHFDLDSNSGVITTATSLDREATAQYFALFRVTDQGSPKRSAVVNVTIAVDDINDNEPIFDSISYTATTTENKPAGTGVLTVTITDADIGVNADVILSIDTSSAAGVRANMYLQVTSLTGVISVKQPIDRETDSSFTFTLLAVDGGIPVHTSSANVTVRVVDENDNAPVFTKTYYNKEVAYAGQCTNSILTVTATDADSGTNGEVKYFLASSTSSHLFSVDSVSGVFSLQTGTAAGAMYNLQVSARDGGTPTQTAATPAQIRVDSMIPDNVVTTFKLAISVAAVHAQEAAFLAECQKLVRQTYPTAVARLWCVQSNSDGMTDAHVYFLKDDSTESVANSNAAKYYVPADTARAFFTTDPAGTPSSALKGSLWAPFDVRSVQPYTESQTPWAESADGIAIITASCLLGTALTALGIYMTVRYCRRIQRAKPTRTRIQVSERPPQKKPPQTTSPSTPRRSNGKPPLPMKEGGNSFFWNRSSSQMS